MNIIKYDGLNLTVTMLAIPHASAANLPCQMDCFAGLLLSTFSNH